MAEQLLTAKSTSRESCWWLAQAAWVSRQPGSGPSVSGLTRSCHRRGVYDTIDLSWL